MYFYEDVMKLENKNHQYLTAFDTLFSDELKRKYQMLKVVNLDNRKKARTPIAQEKLERLEQKI